LSRIFITGCSSGFGLETAKLFLSRGWDVVAAMRKPDPTLLPESDRLQIVQLDVTDPASVSKAVKEAGEIDVLVNNAGFAVPAPVELIEPGMARSLFETNTLGTVAMIQAVVPAFRERRSGVIINVSSSTTLKSQPMVGLYKASKAAVNALSESLAIEVQPFGVRVHVLLPGRAPATSFGQNAFPHLRGLDNPDYGPMIQKLLSAMRETTGPMTHPSDVSEAIWRVVNDPSAPLLVAAGEDAEAWLAKADNPNKIDRRVNQ